MCKQPILMTLLLCALLGCDDDGAARQPGEASSKEENATGRSAQVDPEAAARAKLDAEFPRHGAVVGIELRVYEKPDANSSVVGWLRTGNTVRLGKDARPGPDCKDGYLPVHPFGFVCHDEGLAVRDAAITIETPTDDGWKEGQVEAAAKQGALVLPPPPRDAVLPYDYYFVKEPAVPEYHRLPSRNEQRAAGDKAAHYLKLVDKEDKRAREYLTGAADIGPKGTAITARYLDRGFMVASSGSEVRAFRRFVRTTQGRYIKQARLETRTGHDFAGVELVGSEQGNELVGSEQGNELGSEQGNELGAQQKLPVAWTTRTARLLIGTEAEDGSWSYEDDEQQEPIERQTLLTGWQDRKNLGGRVMHIVETPKGTRYLKAWFAAVAEPIERPEEVPADTPWVHVDLGEQTLVLYEGDTPVYATLVSTGIEDNETPTGVFEIQKKRVTDTMANIGPDAGDDRYRIEDVPHVQYFEGSFALHAAFWHTRFGLPRSHGCVNLAPKDAYRIFGATLPKVPDGFHGVSTEGTALRGSFVVVTE